jgi:hypothetical protein
VALQAVKEFKLDILAAAVAVADAVRDAVDADVDGPRRMMKITTLGLTTAGVWCFPFDQVTSPASCAADAQRSESR